MNHCIGYATLEEWRRTIDDNYQVYAIMTVETRPGQLSRVERHIITLAQPIENEVHYFRLHVASTEWIGDTCVNQNPSRKEREKNAQQAWICVKAWLDTEKLKWFEAGIAIPGDLRDGLLDGRAEIIKQLVADMSKHKHKVEFVFDERSEIPESERSKQ